MNIRFVLSSVRVVLFLCCLLIRANGSAQETSDGKATNVDLPNIILTQTDMQRYDALGAYGNP